MKHIKQDFSLKDWVRPPGWTGGGGVLRPKFNFFIIIIWSCCISN